MKQLYNKNYFPVHFQSLQVVISLSEGSIHIEVSSRAGSTINRSSKDTYNDGVDHDLKVNITSSRLIFYLFENNCYVKVTVVG